MTAPGHPLARLQRALRTGNAWLALDAARELERVPLADAFGICLLLREDQRRYDRACVRWLERFAAEVEGATLAMSRWSLRGSRRSVAALGSAR